MKRTVLTLAMFVYALSAQANEMWSNLWHNADQRGEALLQHGDATTAVKVYADPRRKAYAELKSGDYTTAARDFAALGDSEAHYNQGNALAYAGNLHGALDAYDAALKQDPKNQDARRNRDVVENALKQQHASQQQSANGSKPQDAKQSGQNEKNQSGSSQGKGKQGDSSGQGSSSQGDKKNGQNGKDNNSGGSTAQDNGAKRDKGGQSGNSSPKDGGDSQNGKNSDSNRNDAKGNNSGQSGQHDQSNAKNQGTAGQGTGVTPQGSAQNGNGGSPGKQDAQRQGQPQQGNRGEVGAVGNSSQMAQEPQRDDASQARRDAAASLGKATPASKDGKGVSGDGDVKGGGAQVSAAPLTEKQLAQEQWLRAIPDDPGGLLRRKFLIEHMLRQQKEQP